MRGSLVVATVLAGLPAGARAEPLDDVAEAAARSAAEHRIVSAPALARAMAARLGSGLAPHVLTAWGSEREITEQLDRQLAELRAELGQVALAQAGRAIVAGPAGRVGVVVAVPGPRLPVEIARGGDTTRIVLPWPWAEPASVYAVMPTGARRLDAPEPARGGEQVPRLELLVDCRRPAAIEVRAGARVVAAIVDACGSPQPYAPLDGLDLGPPASTRVELERRVFDLLNQERAAHALPPLAWDPAAHALARAHAEDMARGAFVGHEGSGGATLARRVAALRSARTRENVGHAWGPGEVHVAFMASRAHRENVLAYDVDRGAVGIAVDPEDPRAFYVTELFRTP